MYSYFVGQLVANLEKKNFSTIIPFIGAYSTKKYNKVFSLISIAQFV